MASENIDNGLFIAAPEAHRHQGGHGSENEAATPHSQERGDSQDTLSTTAMHPTPCTAVTATRDQAGSIAGDGAQGRGDFWGWGVQGPMEVQRAEGLSCPG